MISHCWKLMKFGKMMVIRLLPLSQIIGRNSAPTKVYCFSLLIARKASLTREALKKKGKIIFPWCSLCGKTEGPILHCPFTTQIRSMFLKISEVKWTMPHTADLLSYKIRIRGSKRRKTWWNLIPHSIWWTVWKERNSRNFEDISSSIHKVKWNCIVSLFFRCKQTG